MSKIESTFMEKLVSPFLELETWNEQNEHSQTILLFGKLL